MLGLLAQLSDSELRFFEQFLRNGADGLTAAELERVAEALGLDARTPGTLGTSSTLTDEEHGDKLAAETSYFEFVRQAWHVVEPDVEFQDGPHIRGLCVHFEALLAGVFPNLLVNVPPGCMKSYISSVFLAPWAWIHRPALRFFHASYDQGLSTRDSIRARQVLDSRWYRDRWGSRFALLGDQNEKTRYENTGRGWRFATSVNGRGTGDHPDVVVVDDPHKTKAAESVDERRNVQAWWDGTISTRGMSRGVRRAVVMQRLNEDDLVGHIKRKSQFAERWVEVCLPMEYEPGRMQATPLGWTDWRTVPGELLWPNVFDAAAVASLKVELGSARAAGQLQQRPQPLGGRMLKREWFEIVAAGPRVARRVRYWDKAGTRGGGAYSVGLRMSYAGGVFYIENVQREQLSPFERNKLIQQTARLDAGQFANTVEIVTEQEPGSGGKESALITVQELAGYPVYIDRVTESKEARAYPLAAQAEAGNVKLVAGPWNAEFLDEVESFPDGQFRDQIDAAGGALSRLALADGGGLEGEIIATGAERGERKPFDEAELDELPEFLRELVVESREVKRVARYRTRRTGRGDDGDDEF